MYRIRWGHGVRTHTRKNLDIYIPDGKASGQGSPIPDFGIIEDTLVGGNYSVVLKHNNLESYQNRVRGQENRDR